MGEDILNAFGILSRVFVSCLKDTTLEQQRIAIHGLSSAACRMPLDLHCRFICLPYDSSEIAYMGAVPNKMP